MVRTGTWTWSRAKNGGELLFWEAIIIDVHYTWVHHLLLCPFPSSLSKPTWTICLNEWKVRVGDRKLIFMVFWSVFLMRTIFKAVLNLLQYCFYFIFWFFGHEACAILAPWLWIKPSPPELEGKVLTTGLLSLLCSRSCSSFKGYLFEVLVWGTEEGEKGGYPSIWAIPERVYSK